MKILSAAQIREIDAKTIEYEPISSIDLMERAATAFTDWFLSNHYTPRLRVTLFCGTGNNGGDGLAIARMLHHRKIVVSVYLMPGDKLSADCAENLQRAKDVGIVIQQLKDDNIDFSQTDIIIDAIFGTGLSRELLEFPVEIMQKINQCGKPIVSIDVPSGLFLDKKTSVAVQASDTVTFQVPKLALFLPENNRFAGNVHIVDVGLSESAISEAETDMFFTQKTDIRKLLNPLSKFAHKGTQGYALVIGGSFGKIGSICLAAKGALKSGCGLVTAFLPKCGVPIIQSNFPEAMAITDKSETHISEILFDIKPASIGLGMGLGMLEETQLAFHQFLQQNNIPLLIDADGLNILSANKDWLSLLRPKTILTPHPKELERLIGTWGDDFDKIKKVHQFAADFDFVIVVKGAYTLVVDSEKVYMNSSGTPALATAGSGDVLSGIITGLLAQGYAAVDAARIGVFIHGLTADITAKKIYPRSFIATDILDNIGNAYFEIENGK